MPAVAFFDLDKTILARSSALAFAGPLYRARLITRRDVTRSAYAQFSLATGRVDHAAMERMRAQLSTLVAGWDADLLRSLIDAQLSQIVRPLIFAEATELIRRHQADGDRVVIVTSTGTDMAVPIGALLGVDEVLGTRMTERDGHYTGDIDDYMYGPRKAEAMASWARNAGYRARRLLGLLRFQYRPTDVGGRRTPHAVNPDRELRQLATDRGWPIHDFRDAPLLRRSAGRPGLVVALATCALACAAVSRQLRRRRKRLRTLD